MPTTTDTEDKLMSEPTVAANRSTTHLWLALALFLMAMNIATALLVSKSAYVRGYNAGLRDVCAELKAQGKIRADFNCQR